MGFPRKPSANSRCMRVTFSLLSEAGYSSPAARNRTPSSRLASTSRIRGLHRAVAVTAAYPLFCRLWRGREYAMAVASFRLHLGLSPRHPHRLTVTAATVVNKLPSMDGDGGEQRLLTPINQDALRAAPECSQSYLLRRASA